MSNVGTSSWLSGVAPAARSDVVGVLFPLKRFVGGSSVANRTKGVKLKFVSLKLGTADQKVWVLVRT